MNISKKKRGNSIWKKDLNPALNLIYKYLKKKWYLTSTSRKNAHFLTFFLEIDIKILVSSINCKTQDSKKTFSKITFNADNNQNSI